MRIARVHALIIIATLAAPAFSKLPPPSDEAKAKAAETAAKSAWSDKVGGYQLCQAMNRVADRYRTSEKSAGKEAPAPIDTPACADPGAYTPVAAAAPASAPPLEASGAHSPAATSVGPPSSKATAAEQQGQPKK